MSPSPPATKHKSTLEHLQPTSKSQFEQPETKSCQTTCPYGLLISTNREQCTRSTLTFQSSSRMRHGTSHSWTGCENCSDCGLVENSCSFSDGSVHWMSKSGKIHSGPQA